jgi:hypothetical protein
VCGVMFSDISLIFAEGLPDGSIRWTQSNPLYSQHAWEKNLLRYHTGTRLRGVEDGEWRMTAVIRDEVAHGRALICDDPTVSLSLDRTERTFDYALGQNFLLRRITFLNDAAAGTLEVLAAATDPTSGSGRWIPIARHAFRSGEREQRVRFAAVDCRYLRLRFIAEEPGKIYGLGAFGIRRAVEFYDPGGRGVYEEAAGTLGGDDFIDYDSLGPLVAIGSLDSGVTNGLGWSHVEMVSSAASGDASLSSRMLDEDSTTVFRFSPEDQLPTVVVDLGKDCDCGRVSVVYDEQRRGTMKMFLAARPPGDAELVESGLPGVKLERKKTDTEGRGKVSFNQFRRSGRYLILRWEGEAATRSAGFGISEIAVFEHDDTAGAVVLRELTGETRRSDQFDRSRTGYASPLLKSGGKIIEQPVSR